jgi:hypothetical protein
MPNHITNVLTITGPPDDVSALRDLCVVKDDKGILRFDLDRVIPMPQVITATQRDFKDATMRGFGDVHVHLYARACVEDRFCYVTDRYPWMPSDVERWRDVKTWIERDLPLAAVYGKRALVAAAETGFAGWYDWCCDNWGTKWNAYDYIERESLARVPGRFVPEFQTANGIPEPVFAELSKRWPAITIDVVSIDEGGPQYVGKYVGGTGRVEEVPDDDDRYFTVYGRHPNQDDRDDEIEGATPRQPNRSIGSKSKSSRRGRAVGGKARQVTAPAPDAFSRLAEVLRADAAIHDNALTRVARFLCGELDRQASEIEALRAAVDAGKDDGR